MQVSRKGRSILIIFSYNFGCFSLILNPNSVSGSFLKFSTMWNLKPCQRTFILCDINTRQPRCFPTPKTNSLILQTLTEYPTIRFYSDTPWSQRGIKGSVPQGCSHFRCQSHIFSPQATHTLSDMATNQRFPQCPLLGFDYTGTARKTQGNSLPIITQLL